MHHCPPTSQPWWPLTHPIPVKMVWLSVTSVPSEACHKMVILSHILKLQSLWVKKEKTTCGDWSSRRNWQQSHRKVCWRDPQGPRMYTNPPIQESAPEGPNLLVVGSRGSDWKLAESWTSSTVPSRTLPPHTAPQCSNVGYPALVNT